jgi:hypothetical protein
MKHDVRKKSILLAGLATGFALTCVPASAQDLNPQSTTEHNRLPTHALSCCSQHWLQDLPSLSIRIQVTCFIVCANKKPRQSRLAGAKLGNTDWSACMKNRHRVSQVVGKLIC